MYPPLCSETKWTSLIAYDFLSVGCSESGTRTTGVINSLNTLLNGRCLTILTFDYYPQLQ